MDILIDPRAGSKEYLKSFEGASPAQLDAADMAFTGNGPGNQTWFIGIEHKKVSDLVGCIQSGRFSGTQLPKMVRMYDVCFLLVEGILGPDYSTGKLSSRYGKGNIYTYGISYSGFVNFLTSVQLFSSLSGVPCIVLRSVNKKESEMVITGLYHYFQKPWEEHKSLLTPDFTKIQRLPTEIGFETRPEPGDDDYPEYFLRQAVMQIKGLSWQMAGKVSEIFQTLENAMGASEKDWERIDGIGKTLARRAYETLHGHPDPTRKTRKSRKRKDSNARSTSN